ncbi:phosphorylase kinase, gamma catalytic subunit [Artemisia annua]|uniref:Phosphorylase kinase, gamma catalytic subunit n=1 Tax=Artemisia annua TaxID=35608 RepID=A0A2U1QDQ1_ARTAN|nr:phosphorylase kinase, gamma catalytic subunit [Artemisia annua]
MLSSNESNMKKRSITDNEKVYEAKRSKQEDYGDGAAWIRGSVIGKGRYGSVFIANTKVKYSSYPSIMAVKSAEVSVSCSIQQEKEVMDNIRGSANVIKCLGEEITIESNRIVYNMLLEFASGGTLADVIKKSKGKGLLETDVKRHARSVLKGLSHVHKRGYVHCDLKPDNVLLVANKNNNGFIAKIGDLGLAKRVKQIKKRNPGRYWRGNPLYFSPEAVINGVQKPPADIWAFGCIVFEMLTGKKLWLAYKDLGKNEVLRRVGYENEIESVISSSSISNEDRSKYVLSPWLDSAADASLNEVRIPFSAYLLLYIHLLFFVHYSNAFNITKILSQYPSFSTFNNYLTETNLATEINLHKPVTLLALPNDALTKISGKPPDVLKNLLTVHVLLDYYDVRKLRKLSNTTQMITLYQNSGLALGLQGFLKPTVLKNGIVYIGSATQKSRPGALLVGSIACETCNLSVLHISTAIVPTGMVCPGIAPVEPPAFSPKTDVVPSSPPTISPPPVPPVAPKLAPPFAPNPPISAPSVSVPGAAESKESPGKPINMSTGLPPVPTSRPPPKPADKDTKTDSGTSSFRGGLGVVLTIVLSSIHFNVQI